MSLETYDRIVLVIAVIVAASSVYIALRYERDSASEYVEGFDDSFDDDQDVSAPPASGPSRPRLAHSVDPASAGRDNDDWHSTAA